VAYAQSIINLYLERYVWKKKDAKYSSKLVQSPGQERDHEDDVDTGKYARRRYQITLMRFLVQVSELCIIV
jgi:hypothetical protein